MRPSPPAKAASVGANSIASVGSGPIARRRDAPNRPYISIAPITAYKPVTAGIPASCATAMHWGIAIDAIVRPATASAPNQLAL